MPRMEQSAVNRAELRLNRLNPMPQPEKRTPFKTILADTLPTKSLAA